MFDCLKIIFFQLLSLMHTTYLFPVKLSTTTMLNTRIEVLPGGPELTSSDPQRTPTIIIGKMKHLQPVPFSLISRKLAPRVSEDLYRRGLSSLSPTAADSVNLYLKNCTVCTLPLACSRHNTPSRSRCLTQMVKMCNLNVDGSIVVVCEKSSLFASTVAVAKAFPMFSRKTTLGSDQEVVINLEFIFVSEGKGSSCNRNASTSKRPKLETQFRLEESTLTEEEIDCLQDVIVGVRCAAKLADTPANILHTDAFVEAAMRVAADLRVKSTVIQGEQLNQLGFGGILAVGNASTHPPALVVLSHRPPGATKNIAWVGKGIVYDAGGLCIKSNKQMPGMKRDCAAACAILHAFSVAVKQGFRENLHAVLCLAENAVGERATRPDDIIVSYSKKTVEIQDTDAEGRIVLGDGVAYAQRDLKCSVIVDMATLTGAQGIATGHHHAAIMTNSEAAEKACMDAGRIAGELVFPVVFCPELHFPQYYSELADMKNYFSSGGQAQVSSAGLYVMSHIGFDFPGTWIHIDMAFPADIGERATGYGVALLITLFGSLSHSCLLKGIGPSCSDWLI